MKQILFASVLTAIFLIAIGGVPYAQDEIRLPPDGPRSAEELEQDPIFQELKKMLTPQQAVAPERAESGESAEVSPIEQRASDREQASRKYHAAELILKAARLLQSDSQQAEQVQNLRSIVGEILR